MPPKLRSCRQKVGYALKQELKVIEQNEKKEIRARVKRAQKILDEERRKQQAEARRIKKLIKEKNKVERTLCKEKEPPKKDVKKEVQNIRKRFREVLDIEFEPEIAQPENASIEPAPVLQQGRIVCENGKCRRLPVEEPAPENAFSLEEIAPPVARIPGSGSRYQIGSPEFEEIYKYFSDEAKEEIRHEMRLIERNYPDDQWKPRIRTAIMEHPYYGTARVLYKKRLKP